MLDSWFLSLQLLAKSVICSVFESTSGEAAKTQLSEPLTARQRGGARSLHTQLGVTVVRDLRRTTHTGPPVIYFRRVAVFPVEEMHYGAGASL